MVPTTNSPSKNHTRSHNKKDKSNKEANTVEGGNNEAKKSKKEVKALQKEVYSLQEKLDALKKCKTSRLDDTSSSSGNESDCSLNIVEDWVEEDLNGFNYSNMENMKIMLMEDKKFFDAKEILDKE